MHLHSRGPSPHGGRLPLPARVPELAGRGAPVLVESAKTPARRCEGQAVDPPPQPGSEAAGSKPGKIRTWWHPLLAAFLRWQLGGHYRLEEEVPVGQKPLQIDVLL